jgi:hypothetical protein
VRAGTPDRVDHTVALAPRTRPFATRAHMKYFSLLMSLFYVAAGAAILLTDWLADLIHSYRLPIGLLLAGYGVVRGFLWWRKFQSGTDAE